MTSLSDYKIHSLCGKGGTGAVFSCSYQQSPAAIKLFTDASSPTSFKYKTAKQEVVMLEACKGLSNILKVLSWGTDLPTDRFFIVTELLRPINISSLSPLQVQKISRGAFNGLKELHRKGILHGDVKPENCLVNINGEGVLADFGHASYIREKNWYPIQTSWYRDPRVFIKAPYDHTIDLWGMGCTLSEFAMNWPLFPAQIFKQLTNPESYADLHSMHLIVQLIGHPPKEYLLKGGEYHKFFDNSTFMLYELPITCLFKKGHSGIPSLKEPCLKRGYSETQANHLVSLIGRLLTYGDKISAADALQSPFFEGGSTE